MQSLRPPAPREMKKNRLPGVVFVIVLHIFLVWALISGLATATMDLVRGNMEAAVVAEEEIEDLAPPPPPPIRPFTADGNGNRVTARDYPAISIRLRETGLVVVNVCVEADGDVGDVTLVETSGHDRLDAATVRMVGGRFRYNPATQGGAPLRHCANQPVRWALG